MAKQTKKNNPTPLRVDSLPNMEKSYNINLFLLFGGLTIIVFLIYSKIWQNELVWDDDPYITLNEAVKTFNLKELLTGFHVGNYHPLTMLTLGLEYLIVGEKPWLYHFNNLLLHSINCFLLFRITQQLGFKQIVSLLFALLFAIHPLHVESVAWAAERKDVLYVLFLLLSFWYYLRYQDDKSKIKYIASILLFVASCLSKGMAVVLPALLIITDWWILNKSFSLKNLLDKIPYFLVTFAFAYIATSAQIEAGADATSVIKAAYTGVERFKIVCYSFLFYWAKTLLPLNLLPFYPYPQKPGGQIPGIYNLAVIGMILFSAVFYILGRKNKVYWWIAAFFTISISTVLQILPVGSAIVADRYYYLSSVAPLFLMAYLFGNSFEKYANLKYVLTAFCLFFAGKTFIQTGHWKNGYTLFKPAEKFYPQDAMVLSNIGWYHLEAQEFPTAKAYLTRSDDNGFKNGDVCRTLSSMAIDEGDYKRGIKYGERALLFLPKTPRTEWLLALAYLRMKEFDKALPYSNIAISQAPDNAEYIKTHAEILANSKNFKEARKYYASSIKLDPGNYAATLDLAYSYRLEGNLEQEILLLKELINKKPDFLPAYRNLGVSYSDLQRHDEAVALWQKAAEYDKTGDFEYNIGINLANRGKVEMAKNWYIKSAKKGKTDAINLLKANNITY